MRIQLIFIGILLVTTVNGQVIDLTPPGAWDQIYPFGNSIGKGMTLVAIDTQDVKHHYLLFEDISIVSDQKIYLYELDTSNVYEWIYPLAERQAEEIISYYFARDTVGGSHILKFVPFIGQAEKLELEGEWSSHIPFATLDQTSFIGALVNDDDDNYYPILMREDTVEIVSTEGYPFMLFNFDVRGERSFGYLEDAASDFYMCFYDKDIGFVPTSIPSAFTSIVTYNEATDISIVAAVNRFSEQAGLYRVSDTTITELVVPAGPHQDIKLLYRNDDTQTSLFSLKDTAGVVRLAKRVQGNWSDLTSQLFAGEIRDISVLKSAGNDVFINVNSVPVGNLLFNFQSYSSGDVLFNVTPFGDTYSFLKVVFDEVDHFMSVSFQGALGDHLYTYEYGVDSLVPPSSTYDNPNGVVAQDFVHSGNQLYQFAYPSNNSWGFVEHLYSRTHPANPLNPVSVNDTTLVSETCSLLDKVIYKEIDTLDNHRIMMYDTIFQLAREIIIPIVDESRVIDVVGADRMCLLQEYKDDSRDSTTREFITTDESGVIVKVTDQDYTPRGISRWDFNGLILAQVFSRQEEDNVKLWLMTPHDRSEDDCENIDYKYFQEPRIPSFGSELMADEINISGLFAESLLPDPVFDFTGIDQINLFPGAEVEEGVEVNFVIDINSCDN